MSRFFGLPTSRVAGLAATLLLCALLSGLALPSFAADVATATGTSGGATAAGAVTYCPLAADELGGCQQKLVLDLTLDDSTVGGSVLETEVVVDTVLHRAVFSREEADVDSTTATALQVSVPPIRVAFRRGGVQMRYALDYLRAFPAALRDFVLPLRSATLCDDGVTRCPAYTPISRHSSSGGGGGDDDGGEGVVVPAPLGVCCLCTRVECAISATLCDATVRSHFCFRTAAAGSVCVRESEMRYGGWAIGAGAAFYALNATVSGAAVAGGHFPLTTDNTELTTDAGRMQLLQTADVDMAGAGLRLNVSQRVLFKPLSGERAAAGAAEWLLVPRSLVSVSGAECDKVGVTPEHFYGLSGASQCGARNGTCLANQLEDLRAADVAAMALGGGGRYLAPSLGAFTQEAVAATGRRYLLDQVERAGGATLRYTVNADALSFIPVPVNGSLGAVALVARTAMLSVGVLNPNAYAGLYYVAVTNCTAAALRHCPTGDGVAAACVVSLLVRGANATAATFATWSAARDVGAAAGCTVELRDAANATLEVAAVGWTIAATTTTTLPPETKAERCRRCAFHDLRCLFGGVCEWQMLVWTAAAVVVTWCPYAVTAYWRRVWRLCVAAGCCCGCGATS